MLIYSYKQQRQLETIIFNRYLFRQFKEKIIYRSNTVEEKNSNGRKHFRKLIYHKLVSNYYRVKPEAYL